MSTFPRAGGLLRALLINGFTVAREIIFKGLPGQENPEMHPPSHGMTQSLNHCLQGTVSPHSGAPSHFIQPLASSSHTVVNGSQ